MSFPPPERPERRPAPMPDRVRLQSGGEHQPGDDPQRWWHSEHRTPIVIALVAVVVLVLAGVSVPVARFFGDQQASPEAAASPSPAPTEVPASPPPTGRDSPSPTPASPSPSPGSESSATPTAATPTAPTAAPRDEPPYERDEYVGHGAEDNVIYNLYGQSGAGTCGGIEVHDARTPLSGEALAEELEALINCNHEALEEPLAEADVSLTKPSLEVYDRRAASPCGEIRSTDHPAYYCSTNETIYFPSKLERSGAAVTVARLGYVDMVAHEFGHHIQERSGIFDDYTRWYQSASGDEQFDLTRRSELQAQCFSSVFIGYVADDLGVDADDLVQLDEMHTRMGDDYGVGRGEPTHGSSAAQLAWMARGHGDGWSDYGRCNTWVAPEEEVR